MSYTISETSIKGGFNLNRVSRDWRRSIENLWSRRQSHFIRFSPGYSTCLTRKL